MITTLHRKPVASVRFSLFIAVVLFCLAALSAHAQSVTKDHVKYNINNSTKTATATGTDGSYLQNVVIADSVANSNGLNFPVVAVNADAFKSNQYIRSVAFGSNLKKIGSYAFAGCNMLTEAIIPEGVETIEKYAFQNCSMRYVDLPSTLRTLGSGVFKTNASQQIDTLVVRTAYYDSAGGMNILPFSNSSFNSKVNMSKCVLMVPSKAYDDYAASTTSSGLSNWGGFFANIVAFGTAPSGCSVVPAGELKDYRDLSTVDVTFCFDDETLTDVLSLGTDDHIEASLVLPSGKSISADAVVLKGNTVSIDFARVLQQNRELFVAPSEDVTTMDVRLVLDGQVQIEECPFMLGNFFAHHPISWSVPLLPLAYDLPAAPVVRLKEETPDGRYDYTAFKTLTLEFANYTDISLDNSTGAFITARLYKDCQLLCTSDNASVTGDNTVDVAFKIPVDELMVRRTSGKESYEFTLEAEGQVSMKDGEDVKNFRFTLPFSETEAVRPWQVNAVYIPEPTGVSILPAGEVVTLSDLTDIAVTLEGVSDVSLSADFTPALSATLYLDGQEQGSIGADRVRVIGNTLHLIFDPIDQQRITLITADKHHSYDVTLSLVANLLTDGYPCRVVVGDNAPADGGSDAATAAIYTQRWDAPQWSVPAIVCDVPALTVIAPESTADQPLSYDQLKVIEINVENYKNVALPAVSGSNGAASAVVAQLLRNGRSVCVTSSVEVQGNKIIVDFGDKLTLAAVGITPDDDPDAPLEFSVCLEGDLLFDGLPYHLAYDSAEAGITWSVRPVVIYKLPVPTIEYANGRIYFTSGVEGVEYHYAISNTDAVGQTTAEAVKGTVGSSLQVALQRTYVITVYATREGYEDSETAVATLTLGSTPTVVEGEPKD